METHKNNDEGFTLIEMMAVLVIIGLLMGAVAVSVIGNTDRAKTSRAVMDINVYETALERFYLDMGDYPSEDFGLSALTTLPNGIENEQNYSSDGYVKKVSDDPWGRPYVYRMPGENGAFDLLSYGKDGQPGGEGLDADITYWDSENES